MITPGYVVYISRTGRHLLAIAEELEPGLWRFTDAWGDDRVRRQIGTTMHGASSYALVDLADGLE